MSDIARTGHIDGIPDPTGPWNWSVAWNGLVFVSGVRGIDPQTGLPGEGDARRLELIFHHLRQILDKAGSSLQAVLDTTVYVTDMKRLRPLVNDAYEREFGDHLPTRTILEVSALNQEDTIEVQVVAAKIQGAGRSF